VPLAAQSSVTESLSVPSNLLNRSVKYSVYLPNGYSASTKTYPAIYLLHGLYGGETDWLRKGRAKEILDSLIAAKAVAESIVIMPDGGNFWYVNNADNSFRYDDFFITEFIPALEKLYRIKAKPANRVIIGLSMGGYGAMLYTLKHPTLFGACAGLSPALYTDDETLAKSDKRWRDVEAIAFGNASGAARLSPHFKSNSPFHLVSTSDSAAFKTIRLYIDCGDDDFLFNANQEFESLLRRKKIPHEYRVRNGGHTWDYWQRALPDALIFLSRSFD
jgi:enterochelin esterase-like enzyme